MPAVILVAVIKYDGTGGIRTNGVDVEPIFLMESWVESEGLCLPEEKSPTNGLASPSPFIKARG